MASFGKLVVSSVILAKMGAAARAAAPIEACGLLAGTPDGLVEVFYPMTNTDATNEHYSMEAEEQFAAVKDMRGKGLKLLGIWHSHPETPARMSAEDLRLAYTPDTAYVITSLAYEPADTKAFTVNDGKSYPLGLEIQ